MSLYSDIILEHSRYPSNFGALDHPTVSHEGHNPLCGDQVRMDVLIADGCIADIRFSGRGCAISQAAASLLTEAIKGHPVSEALAMERDDMLELIGLPLQHNPVRIKCALLALKTLQAGLNEHHRPDRHG